MQPDTTNTLFDLAVAFVTQTSHHLFVTGKAGTGKTTFLKYISQHAHKKLAVVAPTGVAAINAGGVTLHSFFQLPLGLFIPTQRLHPGNYAGEVNNAHTLLSNLRLSTTKLEVIRELDTLVIDEVSMVRADLLDAVDVVMRHVRRRPLEPFGGVQMVYIGDLYQLPPVVKPTDWKVLGEHYASPFFFDAQVLQQVPPLFIELQKIYRQRDDRFIAILNNIRNNCCTPADLDVLHQYYQPTFAPSAGDGYITLTTHNSRADAINQHELAKLPGSAHQLHANVTGDFSDKAFPNDKTLYLKRGAQVMFIRNDKGEFRRYFNGKIGWVKSVGEDTVTISFNNDEPNLELRRETWRNIRYTFDSENDKLEEEELGTFEQYPLRLAWAITIHKSQGLTFEKAVIDAGSSFAAGQVYVSLSRLTSLDGLVLLSRISASTISTDPRVVQYVSAAKSEDQLQSILERERKTFVTQTLLQTFQLGKLYQRLQHHLEGYHQRVVPDKPAGIQWCQGVLTNLQGLVDVGHRFAPQLEKLCADVDQHPDALAHRVQKAVDHFTGELSTHVLQPTLQHIQKVKGQKKTKKYTGELARLQHAIELKTEEMRRANLLAAAFTRPADVRLILEQPLRPASAHNHTEKDAPAPKKEKLQKGDTHRLSLTMFKKGKSIADIAAERNLTVSTIEGHLCRFLATGEVDVLDLLSADDLDLVLKVNRETDWEAKKTPLILNGQSTVVKGFSTSALKALLPAHITYGQIKAALAYEAIQSGEDSR